MNNQIKPSLDKILKILKFESLNDLTTIIQEDNFNLISTCDINNLIEDYGLFFTIQSNYSMERKREIVNRVLELKYGLIIDSLTSFDNLGEGMHIEKMPM